MESEKALINGLQSEKTHLQLTLKEVSVMKDQYLQKCDKIQHMYDALYTEAQDYRRNMVGINEIKKDRDERLSILRDEIETLTGKHDKLKNDHSILTVQHKTLQEEYDRQKEDFASLTKNLQLSNDVRSQIEHSLSELHKQYRVMKDSFEEKEAMMNQYRTRFQEEVLKLNECERKLDALDVEKRSAEKQNEIQRRQLLDKIAQQNE